MSATLACAHLSYGETRSELVMSGVVRGCSVFLLSGFSGRMWLRVVQSRRIFAVQAPAGSAGPALPGPGLSPGLPSLRCRGRQTSNTYQHVHLHLGKPIAPKMPRLRASRHESAKKLSRHLPASKRKMPRSNLSSGLFRRPSSSALRMQHTSGQGHQSNKATLCMQEWTYRDTYRHIYAHPEKTDSLCAHTSSLSLYWILVSPFNLSRVLAHIHLKLRQPMQAKHRAGADFCRSM